MALDQELREDIVDILEYTYPDVGLDVSDKVLIEAFQALYQDENTEAFTDQTGSGRMLLKRIDNIRQRLCEHILLDDEV